MFQSPKDKSFKHKCKSSTSEETLLGQALGLAAKCRCEQEHTEQVVRLALQIFDALGKLHRMGRRRRFQLHCGALLHDIGWIEGQKGHHKAALRLIVEKASLEFGWSERLVVGLIARYHRKALPESKHRYTGDLNDEDRDAVEKLAAILRVADGLDRTHRDAVCEIECHFDDKTITITVLGQKSVTAEIDAASKKADLMRRVFDREVVVKASR